MDDAERRICHFSGHVQGVGFRYRVRGIAARFAVTGFVRNLSDGRVELVCEGSAAELDRFVKAIADQMEGHIDNVETRSAATTGEFMGFDIRH